MLCVDRRGSMRVSYPQILPALQVRFHGRANTGVDTASGASQPAPSRDVRLPRSTALAFGIPAERLKWIRLPQKRVNLWQHR